MSRARRRVKKARRKTRKKEGREAKEDELVISV